MYFNRFNTVAQIKVEYHRLAKLHHPDIGGETATMQVINTEYQEALAQCNGQTSKGSDGKDHTYVYNQEVEQAIIDKIAEILSHHLDGIELELVGTWIWVGGETYQHKDVLGKILKMQFSRKHQRWAWHNGPKYRRRSKYNYEDIRSAYGTKSYDNQGDQKAKGDQKALV